MDRAEPADNVNLLRAIAAGRVTTEPALCRSLRRLAEEDRVPGGSGSGTAPILLPRCRRIVDGADGMVAQPVE